MVPQSLAWQLSLSTAPFSTPKLDPKPTPPRLEAVPSGPKKPRRGWLIALVAAIGVGVGLWQAKRELAPPSVAKVVRTAEVQRGILEKSLRVAGTIAARQSVAIVTPRLTGPETRGPLTLMKLADPGSKVKAGTVVALFESRQAEDHVGDVRSQVVQKQSDVEKRRAEIMISEETTRQLLRTAAGAYEKAKLDVLTAEVRSSIEAEILKLSVMETEAAWKQLKEEVELQQRADKAELTGLALGVHKDENHLGRHVRDLDKMTIKTPVPGLVVMESTFRGGQFDQVQAGDQVYPGTLFMQVVDTSEMIVSGVANQADIQAVHIGQKADVRLDAYPETVFPGEVTAIGALASAGSGSGGRRFGRGTREDWVRGVEVQIDIKAQDERILPDLSVSADIQISEKPDQLIIPRSAVKVLEDGSKIVQVRQGESFRPREVELGDMNETHAVVLAGLSENEVIAVEDVPTGT